MGIEERRWTKEHIAAELGVLPLRKNDREITIFESLGLDLQFGKHGHMPHAHPY
jgi:hypothetical protein